jgi:zeaxanthin glucosyltransferase
MTHFGIFCPGAIGHLNPMCNLGRELIRRGHQVTLFGMPDVRQKVAQTGLNFYEIGAAEFPIGKLEENWHKLGELDGLPGVKFSIAFFETETKILLIEAPSAIDATGVEALIVDQVSVAVGTVADRLKIPFITICNALPVNREPGVPPYSFNWEYQDNTVARLRNSLGNALIDNLTKSLWQMVVQQRQQWQLPPHKSREMSGSQLAQISQLPATFDFPRQNLPACFHYVGPLQDPEKQERVNNQDLNFPWEKLTNQRLVYASLGTLQNRNWQIFESIAAACADLDVQLVISLGNPKQDPAIVKLVGNPIVVSYAPHQQLIDKAALIITHAGLNTTIGALSAGVPLVAIPITNEQPGIATRVAKTGAGLVLPVKKLTVAALRSAITKVLADDSYRHAAIKMQEIIQAAQGVVVAADIIEQAITTKQAVLAQK